MAIVERIIGQIPADLPDGLKDTQIDHAYAQVLLTFCEHIPVPTLGGLLAMESGQLFCSTETVGPCPDVYDAERVSSEITPPGNSECKMFLDYSTEHLRSSTTKHELHSGATLSLIARLRSQSENEFRFQPMVIGAPWMSHEDAQISAAAMWEAETHFENFVEDFHQFQNVRNVEKPADIGIFLNMRSKRVWRRFSETPSKRTGVVKCQITTQRT